MNLAARLRASFPAFESRDYRRLFWDTFFASASNWALLLGRGWLVFELTDSSFWVGVVTFSGMIPFFLVGPVGGVVADRFDRRRVAMLGVAGGIVTSLVLGAVTLAGVVQVWHVVLLAFLSGSARSFATPSEDALVPNLVNPARLLNAIALSGISRHGSRVAGPLVGAVLLNLLGAAWVFMLSALLLGVALTQLWRIEYRTPARVVAAGEAGLRALGRSFGAGFRYLEGDMRVALVIALVMFHCSLTMAFDSMMPRLAADIGGGSRTFGGISIGLGVGSIAGTLALALLRQQSVQGAALATAGVGSGLAMFALAAAAAPATVFVAATLVGATQASYMALSATLVQQVVPDALRGRVMSIYLMLAGGDMALVNFGMGWLADDVGVRPLLVVPAVLWLAMFFAAAALLPELRHLLRRGSFRPRLAAAPAAGDA
jgi:MFS family permease